LRFNADTGSNYATHRLIGNGSAVSSSAATSQTFSQGGANVSNSGATNSFAASVLDILDPFETTKNTTIRSLGGTPDSASIQISFYSGVYLNTAAVTSIVLFPNIGNYVSGSRFSLYGIKAV
jgi:hypothetical protein